ncbi:hypothetical protein [Nonomuraea sp. NPDC049709]|uniref:hypothetical protein n=1 Tax=Nonomuraea sp. NPDC049709 TaxID=3154736 RepID=UPI0034160086
MAAPGERSSQARNAAHSRWAREPNRTGATAAARANSPASIERWLREVDPDERLPYEQRLKLAESAKQAYYGRLMLKARRAKAAKATQNAA